MLNYGSAKKGSQNMPVDNWSDNELDLIAAELKIRHPKKGFSFYHGLEFTPEQVEEAAESVLPQHRHKSISDYLDIRRPMFNAFTRIAQPAGKHPTLSVVEGTFDSDGRIKWSAQEWEAVILELNRICPKAYEERLKNVHIGSVRLAMEILAIPRRRQFKQIVGFKEQALRTWDALPIEVRDPSKAERPIIDFESGPVMAPPVTSKTKEHPMAAALQKAFVQAEEVNEKKARKSPVHWKPEEWVKIAREMHRQNPHANYFISGFFTIELAAIRDAQRVLPHDRRRGLTITAGLQQPLVEAFKTLSIEMAEEEEAKHAAIKTANIPDAKGSKIEATRLDNAAKGRARLAAMSPEERAEVTKKSWDTRRANKAKNGKTDEIKQPPVPTVVPEAVEANPVAVAQESKGTGFIPLPAHQMDFFGKVLNAALPLMNVLVDEAVSRLAPKLIAGMLPQFEKSIGSMIERAVAAQMPKFTAPAVEKQTVSHTPNLPEPAVAIPVQVAASAPVQPVAQQLQPLTKAELAEYLPQPTEKARRPKIAMLMAAGNQREQMRSTFPEYEFIFIDHGKGIKEAAQSCVLFIAVQAYVTGPNQKSMKAHVPSEKLKYVDGGISAIKKQIYVWKATQPKQ